MQRLASSFALATVLVVVSAAQQQRAAWVAPDAPRVPSPALAPRSPQASSVVKLARFTFIGVKRAEDCAPAVAAVQVELETLDYPADWRFKIACTPLLWERVQRKSDHPEANFAISELKHKVTFFNAAVFREARYIYRRAMSHELGHIRCGCKDEETAEKWARKMEARQRTAALR
jgi:hypothetical protein